MTISETYVRTHTHALHAYASATRGNGGGPGDLPGEPWPLPSHLLALTPRSYQGRYALSLVGSDTAQATRYAASLTGLTAAAVYLAAGDEYLVAGEVDRCIDAYLSAIRSTAADVGRLSIEMQAAAHYGMALACRGRERWQALGHVDAGRALRPRPGVLGTREALEALGETITRQMSRTP